MALFQRRYNVIREIDRLTGELGKAMDRGDEVSIEMILQMRADEMARFDECGNEIWQMGRGESGLLRQIRILLQSDPQAYAGDSPQERKIYEIRRKTQAVIDRLRAMDERLNRRAAGKDSFYEARVRQTDRGRL